ncbi:MAG: endonuclease [Blastocatellales bacterium]
MGDARFWERGVTIYLYHFDAPLKHSSHYLGSAVNFDARHAEHAGGNGSKMMAAVVAAGINYTLARRWDDVPRYHEATLHRRKDNPSLCPICSGGAALKRGNFTPSKKPKKETQ